MEKYRQDFGFYSYKEPLSDTAGKIMTALQYNPPDQNATWDEDVFWEKELCRDVNADTKHKPNVHATILEPKNQPSAGSSIDQEMVQCSLDGQCHLEEWPVDLIRKNLEQMTDIPETFNHNKARTEDFGENNEDKAATSLGAPSVRTNSTKIKSGRENQEQEVARAFPLQKSPASEDRCLAARKGKLDSFFKQQYFSENGDAKMLQPLCVKETEKIQICNVGSMRKDQQCVLMEEIKQARSLVVTMEFHDGSSQLSINKDSAAQVKGIIILIKKQPIYMPLEMNAAGVSEDKYIYIGTANDTLWKKGQPPKEFVRNLLSLVLQMNTNVICFNAKDFLRTVLLVYGEKESWKRVTNSIVLDPRIAAWLLNPADYNPSFEDLVCKYCTNPDLKTARKTSDPSHQNTYTNMNVLYTLMMNICAKLQSEGLWELFCTIELPLTAILAAMEVSRIHVNQEELKVTSDLLGAHLKQLEQDAHRVAGQKFRITSSNELREVLFDKLHLHLQCKSKKLPRTSLRHLPSTAETVLHQLQDLHPLPKIVLEYRQIQKIKSTYIDGLLSCVAKGGEACVSPTWNQTGTVSGRLSAKHPNIQGIPKLAVQIAKPQYIQGKDKEMITINPRAMFIAAKGFTFLAADFSQIELRLMAHFSSDPELLKLFEKPESMDVFTKLASQWKDVDPENVTQADREQAKRTVYSVLYGAGKERLSQYLGITPKEANAFIESFLKKYKLSEFTQQIIQQCQNTGFVVSLMGRKRPLPHITATDFSLRTQAERQAVNFVIQGSAADLCKMAMINISTSLASCSASVARIVAQIHDELLFEVEDAQIYEFAAVVKETMESVQHMKGVQLKVGCSTVWGPSSLILIPDCR
uniref:DNA-directed DNA polymerase n=1 Tax=Xenopus tropicalis TaxID=8364 RepID=A0A803JXU4_XENTR